MQFGPDQQIWQACAAEASRYAMQHVMFRRECSVVGGPALIATNGRSLSFLAVAADDGDVDGLICKDALRFAAKRGGRIRLTATHAEVLATGGAVRASFPRPEGEFPKAEAVVPDSSKAKARVALSIEYLRELAETFGAHGIMLEIFGEDGAQRVTPIDLGAHHVGAIMPMRIDS